MRTVALPAAQMSPCVGALCKVNVSPAKSAEEKCLSFSLLKSETKGERAQQKSLLVEPQLAAQAKASGGIAGLGEESARCWPFICTQCDSHRAGIPVYKCQYFPLQVEKLRLREFDLWPVG